MEYGSIEREIFVEASPEVVFEVITQPEHLREWWPDEVTLEAVPGAEGELVFNRRDGDGAFHVPLTVLELDPPRLFSFRWGYEAGETPAVGNSYLVTFDLEPSATGTTVRMTETGFRERGWEIAKLEETYNDHVEGWDMFIPRLGRYGAGLVSAS
jgi:uncharacterized protein YndB with AHSA1/START domain